MLSLFYSEFPLKSLRYASFYFMFLNYSLVFYHAFSISTHTFDAYV